MAVATVPVDGEGMGNRLVKERDGGKEGDA